MLVFMEMAHRSECIRFETMLQTGNRGRQGDRHGVSKLSELLYYFDGDNLPHKLDVICIKAYLKLSEPLQLAMLSAEWPEILFLFPQLPCFKS